MKNIIFLIVNLSLYLLILLSPFTEASLHHKKFKKSSHSNVVKGKYIVEVNDHVGVDQLAKKLLLTFDSQTLQIHKEFKYDVFSGLVFQLDQTADYQQQLESILDHDYIVAVYPSTIHQRDRNKAINNKSKYNQTKISYVPLTKPDDIKKIMPHHLTQVDRVHKELGLTGKGIRVCVIDSGVDYNHPALGGGFGKGYKVSLGADLIGDTYNTTTGQHNPNKTPLDACNDLSTKGHGTHVSGIIAASYKEFIGVAPDVELGMWRVFACTGTAPSDILTEALLNTDKEDCDVINLSLGYTNSWEESLQYSIVSRISKKGRHFVISAGNEGDSGLYTLGQPSTSEGAMSIASIQNSYDIVKHFKVTGVKDTIDFNSTRGINKKYINGELVQGYVFNRHVSNKTCHTPVNVENKYVLLKANINDTCTDFEKMKLLENSGALAIIYYSEDNSYRPKTVPKIPVLSINGQKYGNLLERQLKHGNVRINFTGQYTKEVESVGKVSHFSSFGPTYELNLKPHLGGIGGRVYSTLPGYLDGWGMMDGTSMASPYISGCVALYLEYARKNGLPTSPSYVMEQFQNYALPATRNTEASLLDTPLHQGAGLIQLYDAITKSTHVTPSSISFNDTASTTEYKSHTLTITNNGNDLITYKISNKPSYSIDPYEIENRNYTISPNVKYKTLKAKLFMSKNIIQVQPHQSVQVKITVVPPKGNEKEHSMYGGYIYFQSSNNQANKDISIPYFGVIGRQKDIPLFDEVFFTYDLTELEPISHKKPITYHKDSDLYIVSAFNMGTRYLVKELVNKKTKKLMGYLETADVYIPRSKDLTGPGVYYSFNGTYIPSLSSSFKERIPIPKGIYNVVYKALRIFGNIDDPKDFDSWVSNDIAIKN
ncbi:unnamed protein product [Cunninghamella blakesleeana]